MNVGYIGLGALGSALARQLLASHTLHVWDVNDEAVRELVKIGACAAQSAEDLGHYCDIVFLCLPRSENVREVLFGESGLVSSLRPGAIVIDQTSGVPIETRGFAETLARREVSMLDAPVSGSPQLVLAGGCTIMISGSEDVLSRALPVLHAITQQVLRCGDRVGDAQAMKLVNNTMNAGCRLATLETVAMGRKWGLTLRTLTKVLNAGAGRNLSTKNMLTALVEGRASTRFALPLMLKDLNQANALAAENGVSLLVAGLVRGLLQVGVNTLGALAQLEDVVRLIETMAATRLVDELDRTAGWPAELTNTYHEATALTLGYVGVGATGATIAERLKNLGKVHVYPRYEDAAARDGTDLCTVTDTCDVLAVWAPDAEDMEQILFGSGGLAEMMAPGKVVVDLARRDPELSQRLAAELSKTSIALVDAPLDDAWIETPGRDALLTCSGEPHACARVLPALQVMGGETVYCGPAGSAQLARLVDDVIAACAWRVTCETAAVGLRYGLSADLMNEVLNRSSGWSGESERILPRLAKNPNDDLGPPNGAVVQLERALRIGRKFGAPMLIANAVRNSIA